MPNSQNCIKKREKKHVPREKLIEYFRDLGVYVAVCGALILIVYAIHYLF